MLRAGVQRRRVNATRLMAAVRVYGALAQVRLASVALGAIAVAVAMFYEREAAGLGGEFIEEYERALEMIASNPHLAPISRGRVGAS